VELDMIILACFYICLNFVPSENDNIVRVEQAFDCMGAVIKTTKSKTGKFTSISVDVQVKDSQEIVDIPRSFYN
jgi:putative lipoic acid-binding regulatory protein